MQDSAVQPEPTRLSGFTTRAVAILLVLYLLAVISFNIGIFPALHGDEAYFGLEALDILRLGLRSPHASNTYTGPVQALWAALVFKLSGEASVALLRTSALIANGTAWLVWVWLRWRQRGADSAVPLQVLIAASPLLLLMARLAWEVSALQSLCMVGFFAAVVTCDSADEPGPWASAFYLYGAWIGVSSHFIFITVLIALTLGALGLVRSVSVERAAPWLQLSAAGLVLGVLMFLVKPRLSVSHFAAHVPLYSAVWALGPLAGWVLLRTSWARTITLRVTRLLAPRVPLLFKGLMVLSAVWFVASGLGLGLLDMMAESVFYKCFAALALPWWLVALCYTLGCAVLGLTLWEIVRVLRDPKAKLSEQWLAVALALWPICFLASATYKTSMRYYLVIYPVLLWLLADRIERRETWRGLLYPSFIASALVTVGLWLPITQGMEGRAPDKFRMGNRLENAHHYMPLDALVEQAKASHVCRFQGDHFLMEPLTFITRVKPHPCEPTRVFKVSYTLEHAPYWAAELDSEAAPTALQQR